MKKLALLAIWLALPLAAFSQCSVAPGGGTQCVSPLSTMVGPGQTPTTYYALTPATGANPCPPGQAVKVGRYFMCGQNNTITVDFGDGNGYVNLQGKQGPPGLAGAVGQAGPQGAAGSQGPPGLQGTTGQAGPLGPSGPMGPSGLQGATGQQGPAGTSGPQGVPGATGPAWSPTGHKFSLTCATAVAAKGGTGVPKFSVTNMVLTGCSITQTQ